MTLSCPLKERMEENTQTLCKVHVVSIWEQVIFPCSWAGCKKSLCILTVTQQWHGLRPFLSLLDVNMFFWCKRTSADTRSSSRRLSVTVCSSLLPAPPNSGGAISHRHAEIVLRFSNFNWLNCIFISCTLLWALSSREEWPINWNHK